MADSYHNRMVLWDEIDILNSVDFPSHFRLNYISQLSKETQDDHFITTICRTAMSTFSSDEVELLMRLLYSSLD